MITSLNNLEITENDLLSLSVTLSKPRQLQWMKDDHIILLDDKRIKAEVDVTGLEYNLTIANVSVKDSGDFTARVDDRDYGVISSVSRVSVKGMK